MGHRKPDGPRGAVERDWREVSNATHRVDGSMNSLPNKTAKRVITRTYHHFDPAGLFPLRPARGSELPRKGEEVHDSQRADDRDADGGDEDRVGNRDNVRAVAAEGVVCRYGRRGRAQEVEPAGRASQRWGSGRVERSAREIEGRDANEGKEDLDKVVEEQDGQPQLAEEALAAGPHTIVVDRGVERCEEGSVHPGDQCKSGS